MPGGRPLIPDKESFTIGEACRVLQIEPHILRYWEARLHLFRPLRRESGHRRYTRRDIETAFQIKDLLSGRGMTLAGARKALSQKRRGGRIAVEDASVPSTETLPRAAVKLLREIREDLQRIASELSQ
ncbi:MAG: MerR family transcriptional regulator [Elusimicrobiota bacterium]